MSYSNSSSLAPILYILYKFSLIHKMYYDNNNNMIIYIIVIILILENVEDCVVTDPNLCPDGTTLQSIGRSGNPKCVQGKTLAISTNMT